MNKLLEVFEIGRRTLQYWFSRWEQDRLIGLYDRAGRGRKYKLKEDEQEPVREWIKAEPKNLNTVKIKVQESFKKSVSKDPLKRITKKFNMTGIIMKRGVAVKPF